MQGQFGFIRRLTIASLWVSAIFYGFNAVRYSATPDDNIMWFFVIVCVALASVVKPLFYLTTAVWAARKVNHTFGGKSPTLAIGSRRSLLTRYRELTSGESFKRLIYAGLFLSCLTPLLVSLEKWSTNGFRDLKFVDLGIISPNREPIAEDFCSSTYGSALDRKSFISTTYKVPEGLRHLDLECANGRQHRLVIKAEDTYKSYMASKSTRTAAGSDKADSVAQATAPRVAPPLPTKTVPHQFVRDESGVISVDRLRAVSESLQRVASRGYVTKLLVVKTIGGEDIERYSVNAAQSLKAADAPLDLLIVVAVDDKKIRLATSDPQGRVSNDTALRLIRDDFVPAARTRGLEAGISDLVAALDKAVQ